MRVLIVENGKTATALLRVYLAGWGLEFLEAKDGGEGFTVAREARPDLIISDVLVPVMDGFELCAAIRSDKDLSAVPVLLLTALTDEANRRRGEMLGATAFLFSPVEAGEVRQKVAEVLHLPAQK